MDTNWNIFENRQNKNLEKKIWKKILKKKIWKKKFEKKKFEKKVWKKNLKKKFEKKNLKFYFFYFIFFPIFNSPASGKENVRFPDSPDFDNLPVEPYCPNIYTVNQLLKVFFFFIFSDGPYFRLRSRFKFQFGYSS